MFWTVNALAAVTILLFGCASPRVLNESGPRYPALTRPLDTFCREPIPGIFLLPAGMHWDVVIADEDGIRLGWITRTGTEVVAGPWFKEALPRLDEIKTLPLGETKSHVVEQLGEPSRTWYDLYPVIDSVVPITRIFGRDTKHCDYRLFTTTSDSDIVEMNIFLSFGKNPSGSWLLERVSWRMEGVREWKGGLSDSETNGCNKSCV